MRDQPNVLEDAIARCRDQIDGYWGEVDDDEDDALISSSPLWGLVQRAGKRRARDRGPSPPGPAGLLRRPPGLDLLGVILR